LVAVVDDDEAAEWRRDEARKAARAGAEARRSVMAELCR